MPRQLCPFEQKIIDVIDDAFKWMLSGKKPLIIGSILMVSATFVGIVNNYEWFHNWFDKCPLWDNFNSGIRDIMQHSDKIKFMDIDGAIIQVKNSDGSSYTTKPRVRYLMDSEVGFNEIKYHIVKNLLSKPKYEINVILNEQVEHRGDEPTNPCLSKSIISFIPVPKNGERYKNISAEAYYARKEVATELFLWEWLKNHRKTVASYIGFSLFLLGVTFQFIYNFRNK